MSEQIWIVRDPNGKVIGASAHGRQDALLDARNDENVYPRHERALAAYSEYNGYTLTRPPLPAPVVVLDEWRVVTKDGTVTHTGGNADTFNTTAIDALYPDRAPHRVMRVCLQEVPADA